jgi:alpha-L-arabinofuranosidase
LKPTVSASNFNNSFTVTLDPTTAKTGGETVYFALFSLFPPTFNDRPNGLRVDLAEASTHDADARIVII